MQKLFVTLKAGSVPPGTTTEKMRCPRCDELLRNLNGGRGNRNHRKRPSSSGSRNVAVNRNQMSSTSRTSATYSGQPQVRMNYSSSNSNTNSYTSRETDTPTNKAPQTNSRTAAVIFTTVTCKCGGAGILRTSNTVEIQTASSIMHKVRWLY